VRRLILPVLLAAAAAGPALAADKPAEPARAVQGAGWASVPIPPDTGEHIYQRYCFECHGEGADKPGTMALKAKYKGAKPARLDQRTDLTADFVIYTVRHGVTVMPSIRKTEIGDAELKAIADYLARKKR
jgi:mono/diheme cytochrome c family protein